MARTHYNVLIYKMPTGFRLHWPIIGECSCIFEVIVWPNNCIVKLHSLMMGQ